MKRLQILVAAILILLVLPSCRPKVLDCRSEEAFCVGLVTDIGKVNDKSFNQSAWKGIQQAASELGATVNYIETVDRRDHEKNIAVFGDAGYDVIVTSGSEFTDITRQAAALYPKTKFIGVDQFQTDAISNVAGLNFPEDQAGFLVGALAAMMSKSHKIGAVCGPDSVPAVWRFGEGYKAGAAYADSQNGTSTEVYVVYHNDASFNEAFVDPQWGAATARSMIDQGVYVVFGCGGVTGNAAITAAAQAGAYAIGVDTDQFFTLPEAAPRMLSSAMKMIAPSVYELIKLAKDGKFPSGNYMGHATYAPFHDVDSEVPPEVKAAMEKINAGLLDGSIMTNVPSRKQ
ncbi:MAG: BMP family ABC transporter substrate-binding protein [Bacteroidota bacterium]